MILFVTGIDTEIGKTVATGLLAAWFQRRQHRVITFKLVQTGCTGMSADVTAHRRLMGAGAWPEDDQQRTCGAVYDFAGSPHLAAELAGRPVEPQQLADSVARLAASYDVVLVEGAGGLFVPLTRDLLTIDLIGQQQWPVALVTAPRLGSINHTLMSLDALASRRVTVSAVLYNLHFTAAAEIIRDTREVIRAALRRQFGEVPLVDVPACIPVGEAGRWNPPGLELLLSTRSD